MPNPDPGPDARAEFVELLDRLDAACELENRDRAEIRLVSGAPLTAPAEHFELMRELGIDDVDLLLDDTDQLDLHVAERFADEMMPRFR
jgi:hypothetical protein